MTPVSPHTSLLRTLWARVREGCRNLTPMQRRAGLFLLGMAAALVLAFATLLIAMRFVVFPQIDRYKGEIERLAGKAVGGSVEIARIQASWDGVNPRLDLEDVTVRDREGRPALNLPGVRAVVSWKTLSAGEPRLTLLELTRPNLDIRREADGKLYIAGIVIDTQKKADSKAADWVFKQDEILIHGGQLRWTDRMRNAPELLLEQVDFVLQNQWRHHRFNLSAVPPATLASPIKAHADFIHPYLSSSISDVTGWKGELSIDLEYTDLAAWKRYFDYPFEIQRGQGAVRARLNFDRARVADLGADVKLSDMAVRLGKGLQLLQLAKVSGHFSAREDFDASEEDDGLTFGDRAHAIKLSNFSFRTEDGLEMPEATISESFVPAKGSLPSKTEIRASLLDLSSLSKLAQYLPLSKDQRGLLADFSPSGRVSNFSLQWQGTYTDLVSYDVRGEFAGLSLKGQPPRPARPKEGKRPARSALPGIPGFDNLSGSVSASERGGKVNLNAANAKLQVPGYLSESAVPFEQLRAQMSWKLDHDQLELQIDNMEFVQEGIAASVSGRHVKPLTQHGQPVGTIDITGRVAEVDLKRINRYLPLQTPPGLRRWLSGAIEEGSARDVTVRIRGDLEHFPFGQQRHGGMPKGEFSVSAKIDNGTLNYAPDKFAKNGKAPLWPQAEKIQGTFTIDNTRIVIHADSAVTAGVALSNVDAVIPDMLSKDTQLDITGHAAGALQDLVRYTKISPVADWIGGLTEYTKAKGDARLLLKMQMPLEHMRDSKVQGTLHFDNNDVTLLRALPTLYDTNGTLEFWEKGFQLNSIGAQFLGAPVTISGGTLPSGKLQVKASGSVTPVGLRQAYPFPAAQQLAARMSGGTRYAVEVNESEHGPEIIVESNLQGLALDFPAPLGKSANQNLPLRFQLTNLPSPGRNVERDELRISLGPAITARYLRQKNSHADWQVMRGAIGINMPDAELQEGVALNVNMHALDLDTWQTALKSFSGGANAGKPRDAADSDSFDAASYIEPAVINVLADGMKVIGTRLSNVRLHATRSPGSWQSQIQSDQITGQIGWTDAAARQGMGKLTARLKSLKIERSVVADASGLLGVQTETPTIPALDVIADDCVLLGKRIGRVELVANNAPAAVGREWRIDRLHISNPDAKMTASGSWHTSRSGAHTTSLNYTFDIANAGKLLERFGYPGVLRRGKGEIEGNITWNGMPFSIDYPSLSGNIDLDIESGQFLQVDPGASRLLGVLSLQALPRRFALDFSDVFSQGFAFDAINATATVSDGVLQTDNLKMRGVSATVLMSGTVDIVKEMQDLHVVVLPEINAGAASVVYGLAINPAIGLGTFLAQLFLRDPLMRALAFEYRVTGSWAEPNVKKLPRNTGYEKEAPPP